MRIGSGDPLAGAARGQDRGHHGEAAAHRARAQSAGARRGPHLVAEPGPERRGPASRRRRLLEPERALPGVRRTREAGRERAPAAAAGGGGGRPRGAYPRALRWWRRRRRRPEAGGVESEGGDGGRGRRRGVRAAFPVPNYEPRVCTWGCSVAPGAEKEQRRRAERSDGGAEEAEVRVGELPGPPRHSGNGLAARRAGRGRPVARGFAPRGDPAPPPQHLGWGGRRGLLRSAGAGGARSAGPRLRGCWRAGRARQRVWPMPPRPALATRSAARPGRRQGWGRGAPSGRRHPLRRE